MTRLGAVGEELDAFLDRAVVLARELTGSSWAAIEVHDDRELVVHRHGHEAASEHRVALSFAGGHGWLAAAVPEHVAAELDAFVSHLGASIGQALMARAAWSTQTMYRTLVEQLPAVTYVRNVETPGMATFMSPQIEALTGFPAEVWAANPHLLVERLHPEDRVWVLPDQAAFSPQDMTGPIRKEYRVMHRDGHVVWVENTAMAVRDEAGGVRSVMGLLFDITERKALEASLREAQKLEAIGKLAGGVAHDFNNLLSVILGWVEDLKADLIPGSAQEQPVEEIARAALRARDVTGKLLAFGRRQMLDLRPTRLDVLVGGLESTLAKLAGERCVVELKLAEVDEVRVDAGQMEQVLLNLVANARDAMPEGGRIDVSVYAGDRELEARRVVCVAVRDDGVGVDEVTRARIFEPFFTTKERSRNTGLGLSTALGIVQQCGGMIEVQSAPGHGATFTVVLPVSPDLIGAALAEVRELSPGRRRTILIVEPDQQIRRLVVMLLGRLGHRAWEAKDAATALDRMSDGPDLVICNVAGRNSGGELASLLRERDAALPLVLLTDHADVLVGPLAASLGAKVLRKPFTLRALSSALGPDSDL